MKFSLSSLSLHVSLFGAFLSFGTFGFLNLFGLRALSQGFYCFFILIFSLHYLSNSRFNFYDIFIGFFTILLACGNILNSNYLASSTEYVIAFIIYLIFTKTDKKKTKQAMRNLLFLFLVFTCTLFMAFMVYWSSPDIVDSVNTNIYTSNTGSARVFPGHFVDWLSFSSGDGFVFGDNIQTRLKGFSSEPSSTVVHYLAPAVIAFWLGGRYVLVGCAMLLLNLVAISSVISISIVMLSVFVWFLQFFKVFSSRFVTFLTIFGALVVFLLADLFTGILIPMFEMTEGFSDLFTRKIVSHGSFDQRYQGIISDFDRVLISPFGFSSDLLGPGSGLFFIFCSKAGYAGIVLCFWFLGQFTNLCVRAFRQTPQHSSNSFTICFSLVLVYFAFFVSGYGWDRLPGLVFLFIMFFIVRSFIYLGDAAGQNDSAKFQR